MRPRRETKGKAERGVALIVALLMTATLSFLALSVSEKMRASARRSAFSADRSELYWRAISAEALAREALADLRAAADGAGEANARLTLSSPLFLAPVDIPLPDGRASLQFADAGRCFNLNSLGAGGAGNDPEEDDADGAPGRRGGAGADGGGEETGRGTARRGEGTSRQEFAALLSLLGLGDGESAQLAATVVDWIDADDVTSLNGAEDDFYTALPAPFRTGGAPLADVSELRAMRGFDDVVYQGLRPFVCALPEGREAVLNVNMLRPQDLPVLAAIISAASEQTVDASGLMNVLEARPPEGWRNAEAFWASPTLAEYGVPQEVRAARTDVESRYIEARAIVERNGVEVAVTLTFQARNDGTYRLLSRSFGVTG